MGVTATYVSADSFTVASDLVTTFVPGRTVRCDCGVDGIKIVHVSKSSYSAPNTTVLVIPADSNNLTSNLVSAEVSSVKPNTIGTGDLPVEFLYFLKGFRKGVHPRWSAAGTLVIGPGFIHIDDEFYNKILVVESDINITVSSLANNTWYAIYINSPSGNELIVDADSDFTISSTMPTYDSTKRGYYNASYNRCIGFFKSNASGTMRFFQHSINALYFNFGTSWSSTASVNNTAWFDMTFDVPIGSISIEAVFQCNNSATITWFTKATDAPDSQIYYTSRNLATGAINVFSSFFDFPLDSSKKMHVKTDTVTGYTINYMCPSMHLPKGLADTI